MNGLTALNSMNQGQIGNYKNVKQMFSASFNFFKFKNQRIREVKRDEMLQKVKKIIKSKEIYA